MTNTVYRLYDFTPLPASVHILSDFKPLTDGVKPRSMNIYQLEELTPLVTGVKSYIYTPPTGRNNAVSYRRKNLTFIPYRLNNITSLITGVKSYSMLIAGVFLLSPVMF